MAEPYVQMQADVGDGWRLVGRMTASQAPGSASDHDPATGTRDVILFGWDNGVPGVWRSAGGADVEQGTTRTIVALHGLELLSDLRTPYERDMHSPKGVPYRARWSLGA